MNTAWLRRALTPLLFLPALFAPALVARAAAPPPASAIALYSFSPTGANNADGAAPRAALTQGSDGEFYGVAASGGANNEGTVFKTDSNGNYQTLYAFSALAASAPHGNADGAVPSGLADGGDGYFYGTASAGGANGFGTAFKVRADGSSFVTLHSFTAAEGSPVNPPLSAPNGYLYGTTQNGGTGSGTLYAVSRATGALNILHTFAAADGVSPVGGLVLNRNGYLYGATAAGGSGNKGTVFALGLYGGTLYVIHNFSALSAAAPFTNADGASPLAAPVEGHDDFLYGVTSAGGAAGFGTFYKVNPVSNAFQTLRSFQSAAEQPGSLMLARDNQFYGTRATGGANGTGDVLRLSADGTSDADIYDFTALISGVNAEGAAPLAALIQGHDQSLYGTASSGSANGSGSVYRLDNAVVPSHAHILWNNANGSAALWTVNSDSTFSYVTYPGASGFTCNAVSDAPDGKVHLLWNNPNGQASVWTVDLSGASGPVGTYTHYEYGPYSGFTLASLATGADDYEKQLWLSTSGTAYVWNVDPTTGTALSQLPYGPYTNWSAKMIAAAETLDLFWQRSDGLNSLWIAPLTASMVQGSSFTSEPGFAYDYFDTPESASSINGAQTASTLIGLAANAYGIPGALGSVRYLWSNPDGSIALNTIDLSLTTFNGATNEQFFGPYPGWSARALAVGTDNLPRLLWNDQFGSTSLWSLDQSGNISHTEYGPYTGWAAVAVSAGP